MRIAFAAALALIAAASLDAQDLGTATPLAGSWNYAPAAGGSEGTFADANARPQLTLRCVRAARRVTISRPAGAAAAAIQVWTSAQSRILPATFDAVSARLTVELGAYDPLLDAVATSRGRVAFTVAGQPPLVVPPWAEVARVIEDCRV